MAEAMMKSGLEVIQTFGMPDTVLARNIANKAKHLYTESPKGNHGPWEPWYNDQRLHRWIFSQSKQKDISK